MSRTERLILVPGYGLGPRSWDPLIAHLSGASQVEIVRYQFAARYPGAVGSSGLVAAMAVRLRQEVANSGRPTMIMTFSLGSSLLARALRPDTLDNVKGVVAISGVPGAESTTPKYRSLAKRLTHTRNFDGALARLYADTHNARRSISEELANFPLALRSQLSTRREPVHPSRTGNMPWLFLFGRGDKILRPARDQSLLGAYPHATIRYISGGHAVHLDEPGMTAAAINEWRSNLRA